MESWNHFPSIIEKLSPGLAQIESETALECKTNIQKHIRANGQVRTGNMLNSVHVENGLVVVGAPYAGFQNYGTRYIPARPFFEPGIEDTRPFFEDKLSHIEDYLR